MRRVGMLRMSYWAAICWLLSVSHLPTRILPSYCVARASTWGAMARQGAHQTAQKSTRTGRLDLRISTSKLDSVTSIVFALAMNALLTMKNGLPREPRRPTHLKMPRAATWFPGLWDRAAVLTFCRRCAVPARRPHGRKNLHISGGRGFLGLLGSGRAFREPALVQG